MENKIQEMHNRLLYRMLSAKRCFYLWKSIDNARNTDIFNGNILKRNCEVLSTHGEFFSFVKDALITKVVIDLFIFFDTNTTNGRLGYKSLMTESCPSTELSNDLQAKTNDVFEKIAGLRHNEFAHLNKNLSLSKVQVSDIENAFLVVEEVFSVIHKTISFGDFEWDSHKTDAESSVEAVLRDLYLGGKEFERVALHEEAIDLNSYNRN
jgi:hypothetical protein